MPALYVYQSKKELRKVLRADAYYNDDWNGMRDRGMYIFNSSENFANYVIADLSVRKIVISDSEGRAFLAAKGCLIDKCSDESFLINEMQPTIVPMQSGEKKPGPVNAITLTPVEADWLSLFFAPF